MKSIDIITYGGLGDTLLLTPSLESLKKHYPESRITVFCSDGRHKELLTGNPFIDHLCNIKSEKFTLAKLRYLVFGKNFKTYNYMKLYPTRTYSVNIMHVIAEMLGTQLFGQRMKICLTNDEIMNGELAISYYSNPITINPYTAGMENKYWNKDKWEKLIALNPQFTFIQLGTPNEKLMKGAVDMRDRSVRDAVAIIKASKLFIGLDSFMAHAATAVSTKAIVLFGATQPAVFGHEVNENMYKNFHCSPCFETLVNSKCPYGRPCMEQITVVQVMEAMNRNMKSINDYQLI